VAVSLRHQHWHWRRLLARLKQPTNTENVHLLQNDFVVDPADEMRGVRQHGEFRRPANLRDLWATAIQVWIGNGFDEKRLRSS
jgi:hypothetical protein